MALLQKIKAALGIGSGSADRADTDAAVTVEQETDQQTTGDAGSTTEEPAVDDGESRSDEQLIEDAEPTAEAGASEPTAEADDDGTAVEEGAEAAGIDDAEVDSDDGEGEEDADDQDAAGDPDGDPVDLIKGIGPAYAERLAEAGIETVDQLAAADSETIAEQVSVGEGRATTWIERAKEF